MRRCNWVRCHSIEYKLFAGVILNVEHDLPVVGVITDIYVVNGDRVLFSVEQYSTSYEPHYRAYILENNSCSRIVCRSDLFTHSPVHIRKSHVPDLSDIFILPFALCTCE